MPKMKCRLCANFAGLDGYCKHHRKIVGQEDSRYSSLVRDNYLQGYAGGYGANSFFQENFPGVKDKFAVVKEEY